jgi:uncharacterized protein
VLWATEHLPSMKLDDADRNRLLALARQSIDLGLSEERWVAAAPAPTSGTLTTHQGSFVTLRTGTQLRGCCGTVIATRALYEDVWRNAWASAFTDPRFSPLEPEEWPEVHIHLSVLSPLEPLTVSSEEDLLEQLQPGIDGLLLEREHSRATFLPDVWDDVPDATEFVRHLKQKAGWPAYAGHRISKFGVTAPRVSANRRLSRLT